MENTKQHSNMKTDNTTDENKAVEGNQSDAATCSASNLGDTPETDNHPSRWQELPSAEFIHADFARKLERERDEAMRRLAPLLLAEEVRESASLLSEGERAQAEESFMSRLENPPSE